MNAVTHVSDTAMASMAGAMASFFSAIPRLVGCILILVIGWFIATLIGKAVSAPLHTVRFNSFADRAGIAAFVQKWASRRMRRSFLANSSSGSSA